MRVRILDSAHNDMLDGYWFYESQEPGVGAPFDAEIWYTIQRKDKQAMQEKGSI